MNSDIIAYKIYTSYYYDFFVLIPEIFIIFWLIFFLIAFTILARQKIIIKGHQLTLPGLKTKAELVVYRNPLPATLMILLLLSVLYVFLLGSNPVAYTTLTGLYSTPVAHFIRMVLAVIFVFYIIYLRSDKEVLKFYSFEYYIILFFSFIFLQLMLISGSFLNLFIFLECYGFCVYYLLASKKNSNTAAEGAIKYFLIGAFSSSLFLFGFFLIYYSTGCGNFVDIFNLTFANSYYVDNVTYLSGILLVSFSFLIKMGASFFFFWIVDVYKGASFHLLTFLNIFPKIVYVYVLFNMLGHFNNFFLCSFVKFFIISSLFFGLLGALNEVNIKRFLIYTSVYNTAFFSVPFWNFDNFTITSFLLFFAMYVFNSFFYMMVFSTLKNWHLGEVGLKSLLDLYQIKIQDKPRAVLILFYTFFASGLPMSGIFLFKLFFYFELARHTHIILLFVFLIAGILSLIYYVRIARIIIQGSNMPTLFLKPISMTISLLFSVGIWFQFFIIVHFDYILMFLDYILK